MTTVTPPYLAKPEPIGRTYGQLHREGDYWYIREGHPALLEMVQDHAV